MTGGAHSTGGGQIDALAVENAALQWLGGDGSEGLAGNSTVLEALLIRRTDAIGAAAFDVRREPGVSHQAMMSPDL